MATLVLTTVGQVLGGPIGGAIGGSIGRVIDGELFGPPPREGPRLTELDVQTSTYGRPVPAIFGRMRIAGSVIWSTDLIEHRSTSGGKGQPKTNSYSYTVNFAVALSSRPIAGIGRIWAEGNLLRGAVGGLKVPGAFRWQAGEQDQTLDPMLAAIEGAGATPAYRGLALAIFEDLDLSEFGNRIPSLTFEIFERSEDVSYAELVASLSDGLVDTALEDTLIGYAASAQSRVDALNQLADMLAESFTIGADELHLGNRSVAEPLPLEHRSVAAIDGRAMDDASTRRGRADQAPARIELRHYDAARDYQIGLQRAQRAGERTGTVRRIDVPAVLSANGARAIAMRQAAAAGAALDRLGVHWLADGSMVEPGMILALAGRPGRWRAESCETIGDVQSVKLVSTPPAARVAQGVGSRFLSSPDIGLSATQLMLIELPFAPDAVAAPQVYAAAAGDAPGWRGASLSRKIGEDYLPEASILSEAVIGTLVEPLPYASPALVDRMHSPLIRLANDALALGSASEAMLAAGANLAWIGGEIVQFAEAEPVAADTYRLSSLRRGLFASEVDAIGHAAGARFVLLDKALLPITLSENEIGQVVGCIAESVADETPAYAQTPFADMARRPLAPVHGRIERIDGGWRARWTRRTRNMVLGWDDIDLPNEEPQIAYRIELLVSGLVAASWEAVEEQIDLSDATLAVAGLPANAIPTMQVSQIGQYGLSAPATLGTGE